MQQEHLKKNCKQNNNTNLNPVALHPQQSLYLISNENIQEKFKFHMTKTTILL